MGRASVVEVDERPRLVDLSGTGTGMGNLVAAGVALAVSIVSTPWVITFFARRGFGQEIRVEGPASHRARRGTPTMVG